MESLTTEKRITDGLRFLEDKNVRFAVVKLISCNGAESNSFIDARCGFEVLQENNKVPSFLPFTVMYEKGVSFLKRLENANSEGIEQLQYTIKEALLCLDKFYATKGEVVTLLLLQKKKKGMSLVYMYNKIFLPLAASLYNTTTGCIR